MRAPRRIVLLALLAAGLAAAGCGGNDQGKPIPQATATGLNAELNGVQARLDNGSSGACRDILEGSRGPNVERVNDLIDAMPDDVDADVRSALEDSFDRLWDLVQQECDDRAAGEEQNKPETTTPTDTTPTDTTPTDTTPTDTTPTETTPTSPDEAPLPNDGDGNGGGVPGNGNGNGGGAGPGAQGE